MRSSCHVQTQASHSLLDMPASAPPVTSRGEEQSWSDLLDWSMQPTEVGASLIRLQCLVRAVSTAEQGSTLLG